MKSGRRRKRGVRKKEGTESAPVIPSRDYLQPVRKLFQDHQVDLEPELTYISGRNIFDGSIESWDLLYQILEIYRQGDLEQINQLKTHLNRKWDNFDQIYWSLPIFGVSRAYQTEEENSYFNLVSVEEGTIKCRNSNCESFRLTSKMLGTTSGDEAYRVRYQCVKCGYRWTE